MALEYDKLQHVHLLCKVLWSISLLEYNVTELTGDKLNLVSYAFVQVVL